ncbi:cobalt-precorrin-5B (C(1))-methyltransferase [Salaquimonas pukyongi]|uniref:cobalt-precorrin-5B (C(1))-methyltransferase n=1 Tax=Salaquimonas pukyongi TaxID=2712698 RepID=UPI00096BC5C7|nr:cobalt-precorrin-5B (C(1))-methyltransferase [Salaquimonas pukyongi]
MSKVERKGKPEDATPLRRGWTTGACATAATKAALSALFTGSFPDPVSITLPKGERPAFALAREELIDNAATAAIIKDAGDDPDVTHGALIISTVRMGAPGSGIAFRAGNGVGTVTKPGLPVAAGEPAINPVPRQMMQEAVQTLCAEHGKAPDIEITLSVPDGEEMARHTWNPRLGIIGGISILGTTGIVHPFSCSAWIHSIHRGIDVCRANGLTHAIAATGSTSEDAANAIYHLPLEALLDMGDFAGGLLKYLRVHPIARLTLAGGFAKFTKLAQGAMDLHSGRSQVDLDWLSGQASTLGLNGAETEAVRNANTALEALEIATGKIDLPGHIAALAQKQALAILRGAPVDVEVLIFSRDGKLLGKAGSFRG